MEELEHQHQRVSSLGASLSTKYLWVALEETPAISGLQDLEKGLSTIYI